MHQKREISAQMDMEAEYIPVLLAFVEKGALALGLQKRETSQLQLAAEEVFSYLCSLPAGEERLQIKIRDGGYYIEVDLLLNDTDLPWPAFNLNSPAIRQESDDIGDIGLLIAARFLDGLEVERLSDAGVLLRMIKDKSYPEAGPAPEPPDSLHRPFIVSEAGSEYLKQLAGLARSRYPAFLLPTFISWPGRLVDMAASGEYQAITAVDRQEQVAGGLIWHNVSDELVEFYGPFIAEGAKDTAPMLVERFISRVARSRVIALFSRNASPDLPPGEFEKMGEWSTQNGDGQSRRLVSVFRLMKEDDGASAWLHPVIEEIVKERCAAMHLPRKLHLVENRGESLNPESAFLSRMDRPARSAVIRPLQTGKDAESVLEGYCQALRNNDFSNLYFELDLGDYRHAALAPALLSIGFTPLHLLPHGGKGDLLVFSAGEPLQSTVR